MKEKSQIEKKAEEKQITLLSTALSEASNAGGHWLNASGKGYPRLYPKGVSVSAFNALFMTLHSDKNGCKTNQFTLFSDAKAQGASVRENEQGVPFLFYNWNKYVHRNNPEQVISRDDYMKLYEEEQKLYKGVHNREIRTLFNIDQTTLPYVDKERYETTLRRYGSAVERGYTEADNRRLHIQFNDFLLRMRDNLVPVRLEGSGVPHYETDKDAVYMPRQREFRHYHDYIQEALRQIVSATGHQQRLAREGMVMKNGVAPSEDAVRQERLVVELASGIKMLELGLPARLSEESLKTVEYWCRELKENPNLMDALESDVNNAIEVINKAERGEKIEYATMRNRRDTSTMQEQMPKHYFVANEIRQHPDKETKKIVLVIDPQAKTADVILPAGASTEVDNEIPGMNKGRIMRALQKDGIEQVRFYNTDGALGYRPDDSYFAEKMIMLARLKNWAMEKLSTLDVASAVKQANEIGFDHVEMIQDDKKRWALYIKPENKSGYSIYPDKEDINRFFSTLKQAMDNIGKVRMELAHKYYALAEVKPDLKVDLFSSEMPEIDLNRIGTEENAAGKNLSPDGWMKKLLSSEDSGVGMSGCNDPIVEMAMTAFSSLMLLAVQIDNKNEEEQKTAISKQMDSGRTNLKSLLPGMKNCELAISENGKAILRVNNGELRMSRELTTAELSRLSATLNNNTLTEEAKRIRVTGMLNTVILSEAASQNFEQGMSQQQGQTENLKR